MAANGKKLTNLIFESLKTMQNRLEKEIIIYDLAENTVLVRKNGRDCKAAVIYIDNKETGPAIHICDRRFLPWAEGLKHELEKNTSLRIHVLEIAYA